MFGWVYVCACVRSWVQDPLVGSHVPVILRDLQLKLAAMERNAAEFPITQVSMCACRCVYIGIFDYSGLLIFACVYLCSWPCWQ